MPTSQQSLLAKKQKKKSHKQDIAKFRVIKVKVHTSSKKDCVLKKDEGVYEVWVKEKPKANAANDKVKLLLAEHFDITLSKVVLVKGAISPQKHFAIYQ